MAFPAQPHIGLMPGSIQGNPPEGDRRDRGPSYGRSDVQWGRPDACGLGSDGCGAAGSAGSTDGCDQLHQPWLSGASDCIRATTELFENAEHCVDRYKVRVWDRVQCLLLSCGLGSASLL